MEDQRNANNRSYQLYLNNIMMFEYSLFANGCIFATAGPTVPATAVEISQSSVTVTAGQTARIPVTFTPANTTSEVSVTSSASTYATGAMSGRDLVITAKEAGSATLTVTANGHSDTISVTVEAAPSE